MVRQIFDTPEEVAVAASRQAADLLKLAIAQRGEARLVAATGGSQLRMLELLTRRRDIDWNHVVLFHLDEFVALAPDSPRSMRRYILDHIVNTTGLATAYLLDGSNPLSSARSAASQLALAPPDLTFVGIGVNSHLAFNEPPADFDAKEAFVEVELTPATREQQVEGGWFPSLDEVPHRAITMTVQQILKSREIIAIATGLHKARAVWRSFAGTITSSVPASALQRHPAVTLYLDREAASLL